MKTYYDHIPPSTNPFKIKGTAKQTQGPIINKIQRVRQRQRSTSELPIFQQSPTSQDTETKLIPGNGQFKAHNYFTKPPESTGFGEPCGLSNVLRKPSRLTSGERNYRRSPKL